MAALECTDLVVEYGTVTAVDRVSITVAPGEVFGLLGPNGAGKTSIIRALTTIVPIARGAARVNGHDLSDAIAVRSSIGVLPESNGYPCSQTARSYLRFYAQLFGIGREEAARRAEALLAQLGLAERRDRIANFSRGMRQRLGLCRALINEPAVLFLDEPTLGLDPAGKEEILAHLATRAANEGTAVVLCSHLLDEVERVCDRVAIMDHGRVVAGGTVDEVIAGAGISGRGRVRVAPPDLAATSTLLSNSPAITSLTFDNSRPGDVIVELARIDGASSVVLRDLLDAGIELRSFDLHGTRLSDAFLKLTARKETNR